MLTPKERAIVEKKLKKFQKAQIADRNEWIGRRHLDKKGDENWQRYVKRQLAWRDRYDKVEQRRYRVMLTRALYDLRKGNRIPPFINL